MNKTKLIYVTSNWEHKILCSTVVIVDNPMHIENTVCIGTYHRYGVSSGSTQFVIKETNQLVANQFKTLNHILNSNLIWRPELQNILFDHSEHFRQFAVFPRIRHPVGWLTSRF